MMKLFTDLRSKCKTKSQMKAFNQLIKTFVQDMSVFMSIKDLLDPNIEGVLPSEVDYLTKYFKEDQENILDYSDAYLDLYKGNKFTHISRVAEIKRSDKVHQLENGGNVMVNGTINGVKVVFHMNEGEFGFWFNRKDFNKIFKELTVKEA